MKSIHVGSAFVLLAFAGCGESSSSNPGTGGSVTASGAQPGAGTGNTGGIKATGGVPAAGATSGTGASPVAGGGKGGSGNSSATGGGPSATGGKPAGGGGGGAGPTGGKSASSGGGTASSSGGKSASGGTGAGTTTGGQSSGGSPSSGGNTAQSSGCGKAPGALAGKFNKGETVSISAGGMQRRFILNVPTNYDNTHPYRLVIVYHARDGNDKQQYDWKYYGLLPLANDTTIFVAPNGQKDGAPCSSTAVGDSNCGWPNTGDSDLALADAVVAQLEENFCIDKSRIFATGWSYGGSMSYRTACSRPQGGTASWGVRGIAIYSAAQLSGNCTPTKPVAFYQSHGTHDSVLNYDSMGLPLGQNYAKVNGCTWAPPAKVTSGAHVCVNMTGCSEGYPLEFCSFNGDHTPYPDNGQAAGSWGPQEAWKFISQF